MRFMVLTAWASQLPTAIRVDQVVRVVSRADGRGTLFTELYLAGRAKPIAVRERLDQVMERLTEAASIGGTP